MAHILLVEDDRDISSGICCDLETEKHTVYACTTKAPALVVLGDSAFNLLLLDISFLDGSDHDVAFGGKQTQESNKAAHVSIRCF